MQSWRELRFRGFLRVCLTGMSALFVIASGLSFASGTIHVRQLPSAAVAVALPPARTHASSVSPADRKLARQELASVLHHVHMLHEAHVAALELRAKLAEQARERAAWLAAHPPAPKPAPVTSSAPPPRTTTADVAVPQTVPSIGSGTLTTASVESLWEQAGGPSWAAPKAAEIAYCESGYNPDARNPSGATGLWQILGSVVPGNLDDPYVNALNAVAKFKAAGDTFSAWVCQ